MTRRASLAACPALLALLTATLLPAGAASADYLADGRTARAVAFGSPRAPLRECLRVISEAAEVTLTAAPSLAEEPLTGFVPSRPLRETMGALEELYDGAWKTLPGSPPAYRLDPDPAKEKALTAARAEERKRLIAGIDEAAANAARSRKENKPTQAELGRSFALALWQHLPAADRGRVLDGASVTISIPEPAAGPIHELMILASRAEPQKLRGPVLATFDLDDRADTAAPSLRARATALRESSITGAVGFYEFAQPDARPKDAEAPAGAPVFPAEIGMDGRFNGTREQLVVNLAQAANLPILSRHRAYGGTAGVNAGGRPIPVVMAELAATCEATARPTSRDFYLLRSVTESMDRAGVPPAAALGAYLKQRPPTGRAVTLAQLSALGALTPLQISILERSNVCSAEATFAREAYAVLRFYRALTAAQRQALAGDEGLPVSSLTHAQLHQLVDQRIKRAEFDIHEHLQQMPGLSFRFVERLGQENTLTMQAWRGGRMLTSSTVELPAAAEEDVPLAKRQAAAAPAARVVWDDL
jgi:hypothetical protein